MTGKFVKVEWFKGTIGILYHRTKGEASSFLCKCTCWIILIIHLSLIDRVIGWFFHFLFFILVFHFNLGTWWDEHYNPDKQTKWFAYFDISRHFFAKASGTSRSRLYSMFRLAKPKTGFYNLWNIDTQSLPLTSNSPAAPTEIR